MSLNRHQGNIGGPVFYEDGAGYAGKGRVFLPFLGSEKSPKEITVRVVVIAVALVLAILLITSLLAGKQPTDFPYVIELLNSIGQPLETVTMKAGVSFSDIVEKEPGVYYANCGFPIDGVAFDLYFYEEAGCLSGFAYMADYQAEPKEAAKDIYNGLVNMRIETFDKYPYYLYREDNVTYEVTRKNLRNHLENEESLLVKHTSDLSPSDQRDPIRVYMDQLETMDDWEGNLIRRAVFYMDKGAAYDPQTQRVQMIYSYRIEPARAGKYQ